MGLVRFTVRHHFAEDARVVWDELVDWPAHADWIPATRVEVAPGDPQAVGGEFTAWTGIGRLSLEDRMRVTAIDWDDERGAGSCAVDKLGPILTGEARFTVRPDGVGATLEWTEDVDVKYLPALLAPVAARIGAAGFKLGMGKLARSLRTRSA